MDFGQIITAPCVNVPPPQDGRCADKSFSIANPDVCPGAVELIIKPEAAFVCAYSTKLKYAQAVATRFAAELNQTKDTIGLITFNSVQDSLVDTLTNSKSVVLADIAGISQSQQLTGFYDALASAISQLTAS